MQSPEEVDRWQRLPALQSSPRCCSNVVEAIAAAIRTCVTSFQKTRKAAMPDRSDSEPERFIGRVFRSGRYGRSEK